MADDSRVERSLKTVMKGAGIVFVGVFVSKALTYLYRILMARMLGPEEYGLFSIAFSVFMMAMFFGKAGVPQGLNRFVAKYIGKEDDARIRGTIRAAFQITLPASIITAASLFLLAPFLGAQVFNEPGVTPLIRIFAVAIPLRTFLKNVTVVFEAFKRMDYFSAVEHVFQSILLVVLTAGLIYAGYGVIGAAAAYALSIMMAAALGFYLLQTRVFSVVGETELVRRELVWFSLPLFASGMIGTIAGDIDNFMLGYFANTSAADVGIYNAAMPTGRLIQALGIPFSTILFPVITEHLARDESEDALAVASAALRWTVAMVFPATLLLIFFSAPILRFLFGEAYVGGYIVLAIIATSAFINVVLTPINKFLPARDKTTWMMANSIAATLLNILLNIVLIPQYGILGAGIATTASISLGGVFSTIEAVLFLGVRPRLRGLAVPVVASGVSATVVYLGTKAAFGIVPFWVLIPAGIVFLLLYGTLFLLLGGLREEDVMVLKAVERRTDADLEPLKKAVRKLSRA